MAQDPNHRTHILIVGDMSLPQVERIYVGGATNVARNAAELGASVGLLGIDGASAGTSAGTSTASDEIWHGQLTQFNALLPQYDVIVLSDYPSGSQHNLRKMIASANVLGKRVLVDPKHNDFLPYAGAFLLVSRQTELRHNVGPWENEEDLTVKTQKLRTVLNMHALLLIRAEEGLTLYTEQHVMHFPGQLADRPAIGDSVIATMAVMLGTGVPIVEAASSANRAVMDLIAEGE